jgi:ADP-ribose pyrophosphatase
MSNGSSCVVPVLPDGRLVLVNQYRYLRDRESLEFPCGGVKEGQTFDDTAVQELAEEAGYHAREWAIAGEFNPYNGVTDEMCRVFIAKRLTPVVVPHDDTEEFEKVTLTPEELEARIISGVIWDGMTIAAWALAKPHI